MHHQISALCESLHLLIQAQQKPGPTTYELLKKLRDDTLSMTKGRCVEPLPEVDADGEIADWFSFANHLLAISTAFLSPEEREESRKFGFAP